MRLTDCLRWVLGTSSERSWLVFLIPGIWLQSSPRIIFQSPCFSRQTVLFSATLPKLLVDFAKAGLTDPTLVRLDVETKVPDTLKLAFLKTTSESKDCVLLHLLKNVIPKDQQTIVFAATR